MVRYMLRSMLQNHVIDIHTESMGALVIGLMVRGDGASEYFPGEPMCLVRELRFSCLLGVASAGGAPSPLSWESDTEVPVLVFLNPLPKSAARLSPCPELTVGTVVSGAWDRVLLHFGVEALDRRYSELGFSGLERSHAAANPLSRIHPAWFTTMDQLLSTSSSAYSIS
jgi:hypothetical protein